MLCCAAPQADGAPKVSQNAWVSDAMAVKAQQLVYMNARGPGCFDFRFYLQASSRNWASFVRPSVRLRSVLASCFCRVWRACAVAWTALGHVRRPGWARP